jgi:hypothetical protein
MTSLLLFLLYGLGVGAVAGVAAWVRRPIPRVPLLVCSLLPIVFLLSGFTGDTTPIPVDHVRTLTPWRAPGPVTVRNPNLIDVALQIAPWRAAVREAWAAGEWPHRNRWNACGGPLAANGQSAAYSPFTLLSLALPLGRAFTLQGALKLLLALSGTWLWLSEMRVSRGAALLGAIAFAFSLSITPWLFFPIASVVCLWPWALFAGERLPSGKAMDRRAFALLTGVFLLWALEGHVESAVSGAALLLLWLLVRPDARRRIGRVFAAGVVAVGISAFALLPHALAILASERFALAARFPERGFWPAGLVTIFFPRVFGDSVDSPMISGRAGPFPEMALGYFGIVAWACVLLVLRPGSPRRREELALAIPAVVGLAVAIGLWPFGTIVEHVPLLRLMSPLRFLSWLAICGSALAAFELDRLRADLPRLRSARLWPAFTGAALAALALAVDRIFRDRHAAAGGLASQREALFLVLAALAVFALAGALRPGTSGRALVAAVAAVTTVELFVQGERLTRFGPPGELAPDTPLLRFLRDRPGPFRVVGQGTALFPGSNVLARLEDVRTHDPAERRDYVEFLDRTAGYRPTDYFKRIANLNAPSLDFLNVKYLIAAPGRASPGPKWRPVYSGADGTLFENTGVMPRVVGPAAISEYVETADTVSFRASVPGGAAAPVVASLANDGGWTARDEAGRRIPTRRANGPFLGLLLPPGDHRVHLRYVAPGFREGAMLSGATLVAAAGLLLLSRRKTA